jgi:DNA-binding response OmpR family regulator
MFAADMPTILVIEDEMLIRLHVAETFRDCGFEVLEAADGAKAIELLQAGAGIDAVFTDVSLPGQPDGFGIARWVRNHRPELPVVLTSGEVTATHVQGISKEPFFAKPCDYAEVAAFIRGLLENCKV